MLDFPMLRHLWTEAGAREVYAELVTQCVREIQPGAETVRPDPGDDGVDVFVGVFGEEQRVWQAKYFCDGLGPSQKRQINKSWKSCIESKNVTKLVDWTLCLPIELSIDEHKWWQRWRKEREEDHDCKISLWSRSRFLPFLKRPGVSEVFDLAFTKSAGTPEALVEVLRARRGRTLRDLPDPSMYASAVFVQKLEAAGVVTNRGRRTAFYNFDLLRVALNEGGDDRDRGALEDLLVRTRDLWEQEHASWPNEAYGRQFVGHVDACIADEQRLPTGLAVQAMHKKGGLYSIADVCEAFWTAQPPVLSIVERD